VGYLKALLRHWTEKPHEKRLLYKPEIPLFRRRSNQLLSVYTWHSSHIASLLFCCSFTQLSAVPTRYTVHTVRQECYVLNSCVFINCSSRSIKTHFNASWCPAICDLFHDAVHICVSIASNGRMIVGNGKGSISNGLRDVQSDSKLLSGFPRPIFFKPEAII
jgi:hypothetical protein